MLEFIQEYNKRMREMTKHKVSSSKESDVHNKNQNTESKVNRSSVKPDVVQKCKTPELLWAEIRELEKELEKLLCKCEITDDDKEAAEAIKKVIREKKALMAKAESGYPICQFKPDSKGGSNDSINPSNGAVKTKTESNGEFNDSVKPSNGDVLIKKSFDDYMVREEDLQLGQIRLMETDNILYRPS